MEKETQSDTSIVARNGGGVRRFRISNKWNPRAAYWSLLRRVLIEEMGFEQTFAPSDKLEDDDKVYLKKKKKKKKKNFISYIFHLKAMGFNVNFGYNF